jgi:hypothetical protein
MQLLQNINRIPDIDISEVINILETPKDNV